MKHHRETHSMADFSVEGIGKMKQKEQQDEEAAYVKETEKKAGQRFVQKAQEVSIKQSAAQRDKLLKLEEEKEKRILMMKITKRYEAFPWLKEKLPPLSRSPGMGELRETDELQKLELDLSGSEERFEKYLIQGGALLEAIWGDGSKMTFLPEALRLNLSGIGGLFRSDQFIKEARPLIKETVIEYPTIGQMSLTVRWLNTIMTTLWMVHLNNTDPRVKQVMEMMRNQQANFLNKDKASATPLPSEEEDSDSADEPPTPGPSKIIIK